MTKIENISFHSNCFTLALQGNGGAGYCFYHPYDFYTTNMILTFDFKEDQKNQYTEK